MDKLDSVFHPRSIAVVGSLRDVNSPAVRYLQQLKDFGFEGKLYAVSRKTTDNISGVCSYQKVSDIPGPVDYVITCVPASALPELVSDCATKRVKVMHIYTAHLGETFESSLQSLEREIIQRAREAGIRVIGPNCMGIYYPKGKLSFRFKFPRESGPVAFLSQSAGNAGHLVNLGAGRGLRFSKIINYGNGADLNESDFLEHLTNDPETKIIAMYVEGVKDGQRFLATLRKAAAAKPVILMKGGLSGAGSRAAASHTASLAGSRVAWDTALKQAGVIKVASLEEMADALLAFMFLNKPRGRRVGVMCGGGGDTVIAGDLCEGAGLEVPPLPQEVRAELRNLTPQLFNVISNPVDYSAIGNQSIFDRACEMLAAHPQIDLLLGDTQVTWRLDFHEGMDRIRSMVDTFIVIGKTHGKPLAIVIFLPDFAGTQDWERLVAMQGRCCQAGFPVYPSLERAVRAIAKFVKYYEVPTEVEDEAS